MGVKRLINSLVNFLLKFSLFYDLKQTKYEMLKEFKTDLKNKKSLQNPITIRVYEDLSDVDKAIIDCFVSNYRKCDNAVYLSGVLFYSVDGIKKRIKRITNKLYYNVINGSESVQMR